MTLSARLRRRRRLLIATVLAGAASAGPAAAAQADYTVKFRNNYDTAVSVAYMRYDPAGCGAHGNWQTKGWFRVLPGQTRQVFTTPNAFAYYYAKAADGTEWDGTDQPVRSKPVYVYHQAFDSCLGIGSTAAYGTVKMRKLQFAAPTRIVNLNP